MQYIQRCKYWAGFETSLALLEPEEDIEEEVELDDPHEVIAEGSDEEFDDLEELEEGNSYYNNM